MYSVRLVWRFLLLAIITICTGTPPLTAAQIHNSTDIVDGAQNTTIPLLTTCATTVCHRGKCTDVTGIGAICSCPDDRMYLGADERTCEIKSCDHTEVARRYICGKGAACDMKHYDLGLQLHMPRCVCKQPSDWSIRYALDPASKSCKRDARYHTCDWPVNAKCQQGCKVERNSRGEGSHPVCTCNKGYKLDASNKKCIVSNPCLIEGKNGGCQQHCSFDKLTLAVICNCTFDYSLSNDGKSCLLRSCKSNNSRCESGCVQVDPKNYYCTCNKGYYLNADRRTCYDYDECAGFHGCDHNCVPDNAGYYKCTCNPSFYLADDGYSCKEVKNCKLSCSQHCDTKTGQCYCNSTFQLSIDNKTCIDINECNINNGGCLEMCNNINGGHFCSCKDPRATLAKDGKTCIIGSCKAIADIQHGSTNCYIKEGGLIMNTGDFCNFTCMVGANLTGADSVYCTATGYDVTIPKCIRDERYKTCDWPKDLGCEQGCQVVVTWGGVGTYPECTCKKGFSLHKDKKRCVTETNPCLTDPKNVECVSVCKYNSKTFEIDCHLEEKKD